jgi:hypothetical protein
MAKHPRSRRRKRDALVYAHLEHVSRDLFERHPDVVLSGFTQYRFRTGNALPSPPTRE